MKINRVFIMFLSCVLMLSCSTSKHASKETTQEELELNAQLIDAVTQYNNGNIERAERMFNDVLAKDKNNAAVYFYLANLYFQKQDIEKALQYNNRAIELNDNNIFYKFQAAEMYMAVQDLENCANIFEKIVKQEPESIDYWQQLASIYHIKKDVKQELRVLDRIEDRFGVNEMSSMQKFYLYREQKDDKKAEKEIENLAKAFPEQAKYYSILAELRMKQKDLDGAFDYYKKVQELEPENQDLNFTFANYYMEKQNDDSVYHYLLKGVQQPNYETQTKISIIYSVYGQKVDNDSLTFERFFSLLETIEQGGDTNDCLLYSLLTTGYMRKADYNNAANAAKKAIDKSCNEYRNYENWLFALSTFAEPMEIAEAASNTIEVYPEQPLPYLFKGVNLSMGGKCEESIEILKMGAEIAGKDKALKEDFFMNIGDCFHELGKDEECFAYYEKVLEINPLNYQTLNNYAYYLALRNQNLEKAEQMAKTVIEKYGDNPNFLDTYAWVLFKQGKALEAKQIMGKIDDAKLKKEFKEHYDAILKQVMKK